MGRKYRKHRGVRNGPSGPHRSSRRAIPWRGSAGTDWPRFGHAKTSSRGGDGVFRLGKMLSEGSVRRLAAARETPGRPNRPAHAVRSGDRNSPHDGLVRCSCARVMLRRSRRRVGVRASDAEHRAQVVAQPDGQSEHRQRWVCVPVAVREYRAAGDEQVFKSMNAAFRIDNAESGIAIDARGSHWMMQPVEPMLRPMTEPRPRDERSDTALGEPVPEQGDGPCDVVLIRDRPLPRDGRAGAPETVPAMLEDHAVFGVWVCSLAPCSSIAVRAASDFDQPPLNSRNSADDWRDRTSLRTSRGCFAAVVTAAATSRGPPAERDTRDWTARCVGVP